MPPVKDSAEEVSLVEVYATQQVVKSQIAALQKDVNGKYNRNKIAIHEVRNEQQKLHELIWRMRLKNVKYSILSGSATAVLIKLVTLYVK